MEQRPEWKAKFQEIMQICQDELKKTTEIGKKMLTASKTTSNLHEAYEELGRITAKALEDGQLKWENSRVTDLLEEIRQFNSDLKDIESEVNDIRFSAPDVAKVKKEDD